MDHTDPSGHDIGEMLAVTDIMGSLFAQISPATAAAAVSAGAAGTSRPLTPGEISMAKVMFGGKINYSIVKVYHKKAYFFQPYDREMTPDGNIYASPKTGKLGSAYSTDYSTITTLGQPLLYSQSDFIHEMTHVWQHQVGMNVRTRAVFNRNYDYDFATFGTKDFKSYGIEEQAMIVQDFFLLLHGGQIYRNGSPVTNHPPAQTYQIITGKYFP